MKPKLLASLAVLLGLLFVCGAVAYWRVPAGQLPHWVPGYEAGSTTIHLKHGIASLLLGLASFAFAWFYTGGERKK